MKMRTAKTTGFFIIAALLLIAAGWYAHGWYHRCTDTARDRRIKLQGFHFVSPLLDVELPEGYGVGREPIPFKYKIKAFVDQELKSGKVRELSVYYRDLSDGPWFGINEKVQYNPSSMMKVPIMIAWLKRAEKDPAVLRSRLFYDEKNTSAPPQGIKPVKTLVNRRSYTVDELLHYMLNYSDNKAAVLLLHGLRKEELDQVIHSMDITSNPNDDGQFQMTAHGYSGFFRILYNASFLNREMSEKALQLLSLQDFPYGIAAGVPKGLKVASKFGEYVQGENGEDRQLHEFGIVYHPNGPYILGIMTRGRDLAKQTDILRDV
jgi:beta-lactamase class A